MIKVWYFSGTGHSRKVAEFLAQALDAPLCEIGGSTGPADTAVVVFPVYCQNIPAPVKDFLLTLSAEHVALFATYGKMGCGNVLWEAARLVNGRVIAAGYIPTGHTYLQQDGVGDLQPLLAVIPRIQTPQPVSVPKGKKWWLADVVPDLRSQISVKLRRTEACSECGLCGRNCPMGTMQNGKPGKNCIRCLRCVVECPKKAIRVSYHPLLRWYLRKPKQEEWILYL